MILIFDVFQLYFAGLALLCDPSSSSGPRYGDKLRRDCPPDGLPTCALKRAYIALYQFRLYIHDKKDIKGASERVDKILQRYGYKLGHHLTHTLESKLSKLKDMRPDSDKCGVIYKIKCNECNHVYIGETGKELYKRVSEHKLAVRRGDNLSAIYHHISGHSMNWDHTEVLAQQSTAEKRRILESMYSNNNNNALNRSSKLPNAYSSIVNQIVRHN